MATERYQYGVCDFETGITYPMPWDWCEIVHARTGCTIARRVVRDDGAQVSHGEWHPVMAGGGR